LFMAHSVPAWKTYPVASGGTTRRWKQVTIFSVTGAAADNDWDFGDGATGAFFTSAIADGTHGAKATALAAHLAALTAKTAHNDFRCSAVDLGLYVKVAGATGGATEYKPTLDGTSKMPELLFHAASAPTAAVIVMETELLDAATPIAAVSYGTI
jgi:hypothetical protein